MVVELGHSMLAPLVTEPSFRSEESLFDAAHLLAFIEGPAALVVTVCRACNYGSVTSDGLLCVSVELQNF